MIRHKSGFVLMGALLLAGLAFAKDPRPVKLTLKDLKGQKVRLQDFRGKPVVLNFWATWCGPCREEMPLFVELEEEYGPRGAVFVAVSLDARETRTKIPDFIATYKIGFPVWTGASLLDLEDLKLGQGLPATAFLDREGRIVARVLGQVTRAELEQRLKWLTGEPNAPAPPPLIDHLSQK